MVSQTVVRATLMVSQPLFPGNVALIKIQNNQKSKNFKK
jgi:hypothetical protein